jgi:hypothetical protein
MSTKRSLTDELQSVMLAHSLDAPEPTASIENVLSKTVATTAPAAIRRRRWFPSPTMIAAAAVVALLVGGVVLLDSSRQESHKSSAGSNASLSGQGDAKAAAGVTPPRGSNDSAGASPAPQALGSIPAPACVAAGAGTAAGTGYSVALGPSNSHVTIADAYCNTPNGSRTGSAVEVYRITETSRTAVATLIRPEQQLHVDQIEQRGQTVVVTALDTSSGSLNDYRFSTTNGTTFTAEPVTLVATACAKSTLEVRVRDGSVRAGVSASLIDLRNRGAQPCVIEGYPDIAATVTNQLAVTAQAVPHGLAGGSSTQAPPIVLLQPGAAGTAMIEYLTKAPANVVTPCESAKQLTISLRGEPLATVPFVKSICSLQIHPVVSSPSGSD